MIRFPKHLDGILSFFADMGIRLDRLDRKKLEAALEALKQEAH